LASAHEQSVPIFQQLSGVTRLFVMTHVRFPLSLRKAEDLRRASSRLVDASGRLTVRRSARNVSCRREADIANRGLGRLNRADSAPTGTALGMTAVRAIAALPLRAQNSLHCPKLKFPSCIRVAGLGAQANKKWRTKDIIVMPRPSAGRGISTIFPELVVAHAGFFGGGGRDGCGLRRTRTNL
jgi:hypothetical protein